MIAEIRGLTILTDEDAAITVAKYAEANIRPYTVSLGEPPIDLQLTTKQARDLLWHLIHLLPEEARTYLVEHTCTTPRCPLCGATLEEVVGVMGDEPAVGVRCPRGCDLTEVYL